MAYLEWSNYYSVKIPILDIQHQKLFDYINNLAVAIEKGHSKQQTYETLKELVRYCRTHFQAEEALMRDAGFPHLQDHILVHREFYRKTEDYVKDAFQDGADVGEEVLSMLKDWLTEHILGMDQRYIPFLERLKKESKNS